MTECIIMRGLPGSGKSHKARRLQQTGREVAEQYVILSADDWFIDTATSEYLFDFTQLKPAHRAVRKAARRCLEAGVSIIVDNTHSRRAEWGAVRNIASGLGVPVREVMPSNWWSWDVRECYLRGAHGCPEEKIQQMKERWETWNVLTD